MLTLFWFSSKIFPEQWTDSICVDVTPLAALNTANIPDFYTKRLVSDCLIVLCIPETNGNSFIGFCCVKKQ